MDDAGSLFFDLKRDPRIFADTPKKKAFYFPTTEVLKESKEAPPPELSSKETSEFKSSTKGILELKKEQLPGEFGECFEVWPNEEGILDHNPTQKKVQVIEVEGPLGEDRKRPDPHILGDSYTDTPRMYKLVQNFRNAPAKSRAERRKEANSQPKVVLEPREKVEQHFPVKDTDSSSNEKLHDYETMAVRSSEEPNFGQILSKPKLKLRGVDKPRKQLPEQEDEVDVLNKRIADVLSQSESLTLSNSFSLSDTTETSIKWDDRKTVRNEISPRQVPTSQILKATPVRKEEDILYQWRLRKKMESARRGTQFMIAEKEYESHSRRNLKFNEGKEAAKDTINPTPKVGYGEENYKVRAMEDLNVTLSDLRQKMRFGNQNSDESGKDSAIVNTVEKTLSQGPLFEMQKKMEMTDSACQIDTKCSDSCYNKKIKGRNYRAPETTEKHDKAPFESQYASAHPKQIQAATTTTQTDTCSSINPMFSNPYNTFPYFFPPFSNPFMASYQMPLQLENTMPGYVAPMNSENLLLGNTYSQLQYNNNQLPIIAENPNRTSTLLSQPQTLHGCSVKKSDHPSRLFSKKSSTRKHTQFNSIESTLTNVSSLDITQDISRVSSDNLHLKSGSTRNNLYVKGSTDEFAEIKPALHGSMNVIQPKVIESVVKTHADSLMWNKCEKCLSLPRFEAVDFKLHYVASEAATQCRDVPSYFQAIPVKAEMVEVPESINLISLRSQTASYSYDFEEELPHNELLPEKRLLNSGSLKSFSCHDSVPEDIESNHDSKYSDDDGKSDTITLAVDAEMQTDLTGSFEHSRISHELQLVEDLSFSKSTEVAIQTTDINLVDDETQTSISLEIPDVKLGSAKTRYDVGLDTVSTEQGEAQDDLIDADIEKILRNDFDQSLDAENPFETGDLADMKRRLKDAYDKVLLQKENLEKILSSFDD